MEARNTQQLDLRDEIYARAVISHDCSHPGDIVGLDALKAYYQGSHEGLPDFKGENDEVLAAGDKIVLRWTITGTHTGTLRGLPPTNKRVEFSGIALCQIADGKIVEEWVYFNVLDLFQQLGFSLVPPGSTA